MDVIRPQINAKGFRTAVKDYTEESVIEELAANSYDEQASTVVVLLGMKENKLYIIDDGGGFTDSSIRAVATLGGGNKSMEYYNGTRAYLGSYGYGLKSTLNIAHSVDIESTSKEGSFRTTIDWTQLDVAFETGFGGFQVHKSVKPSAKGTGTTLTLTLKRSTEKVHLEDFGRTLSNLPTDEGKFHCYYGLYNESIIATARKSYPELRKTARQLYKAGKLKLASESLDSELQDCESEVLSDKEDKEISAKVYFAGIERDKIKSLKSALRGIYVRVHGRLLKHNFSEDLYTYGISKYQMFKQGLRVELTIDWLRDQITLSRDGVKFTNEKMQELFKQAIQRILGRFIRPKLTIIERKKLRGGDKMLKQRLELAHKRSTNSKGIVVKGISGGFVYIPETDAELAILLAQQSVIQRIDRNLRLIDYNSQAPFDCILYNASTRNFIYTELEPTLMEFIGHKTKDKIELVIVWSQGKWRMGAKKKGVNGVFELTQGPKSQKGHYKLLEYASVTSKKPRNDYKVIVLDQLLL